MLLLLVPTMVWTVVRVPRMRRVVEFLCLLPLAIPAIVIVVGIAPIYQWMGQHLGAVGASPLTLALIDIILVLPYSYRAIDSSLRSIDTATLADAARSLGAGWPRTILQVIVPNIRGGILSASVLAIALVLGEYTISSLLSFNTLQVVIFLLGKRDPFVVGRRLVRRAALRVRPAVHHLPLRPRRRPSGPASRRGARRMTATSPSPAATGHGVAVAFEEMHRWYGPVHALDGLSIDIAPGELIALLGPSGCGKTTALRALGGLDEVDSGRILVDGKDMTHVPANKRNMGIVFQAYSLFPNMTARDNVGLRAAPARRRREPRARSRPTRCSSSSAWASRRAATRTRCPAASSSASRSPGRLPSSRACSCSTSRCRRSTPRSVASSARRSGASRSWSASPPCS